MIKNNIKQVFKRMKLKSITICCFINILFYISYAVYNQHSLEKIGIKYVALVLFLSVFLAIYYEINSAALNLKISRRKKNSNSLKDSELINPNDNQINDTSDLIE